MRWRAVVVAGAGIASMLAGGCMTGAVNVVEKIGPEYTVTENSWVLANHLRLLERTTRHDGALIEAQIRAINPTLRDVMFEYKFVWLDRSGMELKSQTSVWIPVRAGAKESVFMKAGATSPDASDFIFYARFAR